MGKLFKEKVIGVLDRTENNRYVTELRVVCWNIDGKDLEPVLERCQKMKVDGIEKYIKRKGITYADLKIILAAQDQISQMLSGTAPATNEVPVKREAF